MVISRDFFYAFRIADFVGTVKSSVWYIQIHTIVKDF